MDETLILEVDLDSFLACLLCLRVIPIILAEGYLLFLFARELIKGKICYDRVDRVIFFLSALVIAVDLFSLLVMSVAISSLSHLLRLVWTLAIYFSFLRFVLEYR
jgi:hypothetical protein